MTKCRLMKRRRKKASWLAAWAPASTLPAAACRQPAAVPCLRRACHRSALRTSYLQPSALLAALGLACLCPAALACQPTRPAQANCHSNLKPVHLWHSDSCSSCQFPTRRSRCQKSTPVTKWAHADSYRPSRKAQAFQGTEARDHSHSSASGPLVAAPGAPPNLSTATALARPGTSTDSHDAR